jgi:hypothetical protein
LEDNLAAGVEDELHGARVRGTGDVGEDLLRLVAVLGLELVAKVPVVC